MSDGLKSRGLRIARRLDPDPARALQVFCMAALIFWVLWWGRSFGAQELQAGKHLWFPPGPIGIGCDFYRHVDHPARIWWQGGDPYADKEKFFPYPPSEMRLFAWVNLMPPRAAYGVWLVGLTVILGAAAWAAARWRRRLGLTDIPPAAAIVAVLFSTPALFALERGQYDALGLLFILAALPMLNHSSKGVQYLGGAVLCLALWAKVYPGLMLVGLIGLRNWRALAGFLAAGVMIALGFFASGELMKFWVNNADHVRMAEDIARLTQGLVHPWNHPLSTALSGLWLGTAFSGLGLAFGKILAALILLPLLAWVTWRVYRYDNRQALAYPYLLWVCALATFVPPVSNDYNLVFLPLAVLAVWSRRDPLLVQVALALLLIWWQPVAMSVSGGVLFGLKLLGLGAVAVCLVGRSYEPSDAAKAKGDVESRRCGTRVHSP